MIWKKILVTLFIIVGFLPAFAYTPVDSIGRKSVDGKDFIIYMVSGGETIYGISTKFNVPIDQLMEHNPELVNGLKTAMILSIPYKPEEIENLRDNRKKHIVQPGETLYGISKKFNIALNDLLKWNGMELKAGQTLFLSPSGTSDKEVKASEPDNKEFEEKEFVENKEEEKKEEPKEIVKEVKKEEVKEEEKPKEVFVSTNPYWTDEVKPAPELGPKLRKRVMIIPFDPYLYFSDADAEIARASNIQQTKVREVFRRRLNAMLEPKGYETIHLLGGVFKDSIGDLNKIYKSVNYNYQDILDNGGNHTEEQFLPPSDKKTKTNPLLKIVDLNAASHSKNPVGNAMKSKDNRYFGVKISDPRFFDYFGKKYGIDYYVFINQFEVRTDYQTCLDRSSNKYERNFLTHFSIFDDKGNQLAGNKITTYYHSNSNNVSQIVLDNIPQVAEQIMQQVPPLKY